MNYLFEKDFGMNWFIVGDVVENECVGVVVCSVCVFVVYWCDR